MPILEQNNDSIPAEAQRQLEQCIEVGELIVETEILHVKTHQNMMSALQVLEKYDFFIIRNMLVYVDLYCTKRHHLGLRCIKIVGGWGSAPDPAGGAYSAPPDPLAGFGEGRGEGEGEGRGKGGGGEGRDKKSVQALLFYTLSTARIHP